MSISTSHGPFCDAAQNGPVTRDALICGYLRTPFGRYGGVLARLRPDLLAAHVLRAIVERHHLAPATVDDVIFGCANQAGEDNRNVARMALLLAGFPVEVPGQTVNRLCGSSLQALNGAAQAIWSGQGDLFVAGGVESMTRAPVVMLKAESEFPRGTPQIADSTLGWRFAHPDLVADGHTVSLGETAENVAERRKISREDQDCLAYLSQRKAERAMADGRLAEEIVATPAPGPQGATVAVDRDEHPRPGTSLEALAKLRPAFRANGSVTAGNSSGINDGASTLLVASGERGRAPRRDRGARARAPQGPLRSRDDVHRRRPGDRDGAGARGLIAGRASLAADQSLRALEHEEFEKIPVPMLGHAPLLVVVGAER